MLCYQYISMKDVNCFILSKEKFPFFVTDSCKHGKAPVASSFSILL